MKKYFYSSFIKEQTKRIRDMEKELENGTLEIPHSTSGHHSGYINGSYYMLSQIKKLLKREEL